MKTSIFCTDSALNFRDASLNVRAISTTRPDYGLKISPLKITKEIAGEDQA